MEADFVIVGSGSDGKYSVIVIEFGGTDIGPFIQMPAALSFPMNMSTYDWGFISEPEPHLGGRTLVTPRGKVIGGSSSINGMVYVRGHAHDFDHWAESGLSERAGPCSLVLAQPQSSPGKLDAPHGSRSQHMPPARGSPGERV